MLKIGVIGLGYWGPNLLRNIYANGRCGDKNIVICDSDASRLERTGVRYPALRRTTNYRDLIEDTEIDAVVISTGVSSHFPLAKEALTAGKHVFVEKPFALSSAEAEELVELADRKGLVSMVGHTFLYSPPVLKTKEIIDAGELGTIHFITSTRVNLGLHQRDVSVIWDLAPHDFSMIFYWLGEEPDEVEAFGEAFVQEGIPDVAFVNLHFPGGAIANIQLAWLAPSKLRRTVIVGSSKMLVYDDTEPYEKIKVYDKGVVKTVEPESFGEFHLSYRTGDIVSPKLPGIEPLAAEMEDFLACVESGGTPRSSGLNGLQVVKALERAERSLLRRS